MNGAHCSCGSFAGGTYDYSTIEGADCCSGHHNFDASFTTWTPGPGRTWIVVKVTKVTGEAATDACCK